MSRDETSLCDDNSVVSTLSGNLMMERVFRWPSSQRRVERTPLCLLLIILSILPLCLASELNKTCAPGLNTPGVTFPRGDIFLEEGQTLNISCVLNLSHPDAIGKNASDLVFYRNKDLVSDEFLILKDATTLQLYIKEMPASDNMFYCRLRNQEADINVCLNKAVVGYKPQEAHNFTCTSHNWQSLTCTWKPPFNYIHTTYTLQYRTPGRAGGRIPHGCPDKLDIRENRCFWNSSTAPQYRQPYEYYFFTLVGHNVLGNITTSIKFHHYAHMIPAKPEELKVVNKTSYSILLRWKIPYPLQVFPPGLIQKVEYQHHWESRKKWEVANTSCLNIKEEHHIFNLSNLEYANTFYDIRIYTKSAAALRDDMWSSPAKVTVRTNPDVPGAAPKTDIGSFEIAGGLPLRDVYVYWQQIPDHLHNGDRFEYKFIKVKENDNDRELVPHEVSRSYAKFKGLSFNQYTFTIVASNTEGYSRDSSVVVIPSQLEIPGEPLSFTKIAFGNGIYELSWKHPKDHERIVNYTIFWCNNERDRPYQCMGYLNWTKVPKDTQIINITVPEEKIYQFAISANAVNASSGMVWASCTVIHNKAVGKMKSVWINHSGSTFIEVGWKLECSDRIGLVQGYRVYYCPIISPYNLTCREPEKNTTFDSGKIHGRIENLKPYTTYMVAVSVLTKSGEGLQSDPLYNTTFEGAPDTPPTNVTITEITNTTMKVSWVPPASMNGVLRFFKVFYNDKTLKVENRESHVTLTDLKSFTSYNVSVTACTVSCSMKSDPVNVITKVGIPGTMERPTVNFINSSQVMVSWLPPKYAAGITTYYELKVGTREGRNPSADTYYKKSEGLSASISVPDCQTEGTQISTFAVRAVNVAPGSNVFRGNWSEIGEANCFNAKGSKEIQIWVGVGFAVILGFVGLGYCGKKVWAKFKKMQDVQVKLPSGLEHPKEKDMAYGPERIDWQVGTFPPADGDHRNKKPGAMGAADEQCLLQQKERHGRNPSGDSRESSGCSSAADSVSSAATSRTQISSDSGADMKRCLSQDIMFRNPGDSQLRLRNVGQPASSSLSSDLTDIDGLSVEDIQKSKGKESPKQSSDYLRFSVTDTLDSPQPYISFENLNHPSLADAVPDTPYLDSMANSNYVSHPNIWLPKEPSLLIPVHTEDNETVGDEGSGFVAPDSYCRMGWRPGPEHSAESEGVTHFQERPSMSEADAVGLVPSQASEGYVTVASLGAGMPATGCHPVGILPSQDCALDEEDVSECSRESSSNQGHVTSPGYVALRYFAKEDGICNSRHDAVGSSPLPTSANNHSLTNEES